MGIAHPPEHPAVIPGLVVPPIGDVGQPRRSARSRLATPPRSRPSIAPTRSPGRARASAPGRPSPTAAPCGRRPRPSPWPPRGNTPGRGSATSARRGPPPAPACGPPRTGPPAPARRAVGRAWASWRWASIPAATPAITARKVASRPPHPMIVAQRRQDRVLGETSPPPGPPARPGPAWPGRPPTPGGSPAGRSTARRRGRPGTTSARG